MSQTQELKLAKQWITRLSLLCGILLIGGLILQRSYSVQIRQLEQSHYATAIQVSELYKAYVDQKIFYVEFLVKQEILDPQELENVYAERSEIVKKEKERIQFLQSKYHIPLTRSE